MHFWSLLELNFPINSFIFATFHFLISEDHLKIASNLSFYHTFQL